MIRVFGRAYAIWLAGMLGLASSASAQSGLPDLSLEELMKLDAGQVYGASERLQPVIEAPSSVSFITAEEIARYGYRTLADILRSIRGMYVTDDRNFSLIGVRGFAKPGDYNSRILLLVNGHRVNDNVFGQAEIGAEFGLDPATFERVEVIRGSTSSLYGDSAFFAVVNVITRTGTSLGGGSIALETGTLGTRLVRATVGHRFRNGADLALSSTYEHSDGVGRLYFPAFDAPDTNNGVAEGLDGEDVRQFYSRLDFNGLTVTGAYGSRHRDVPTASFGTLFNHQDSREQTTDRHTLVDAEYGRSFSGTRVTFRVSFDGFSYDGTYPFAGDDSSAPIVVRLNSVVGTRWSVGSGLTRAFRGRHTVDSSAPAVVGLNSVVGTRWSVGSGLTRAFRGRHTVDSSAPAVVGLNSVVGTRWSVGSGLTRAFRGGHTVRAGVELIDNTQQDQTVRYVDSPGFLLDIHSNSTQHALYLQDEVKLARWLIVNAGLRYDGYEKFLRVTPRAALIVLPSSTQSLKYLYGTAFRAPNAYELNTYYFGDRVENLRPESIDTHEIVWERYVNDWLRTSVSTYWYKADRLITAIPDDSTFLGISFDNQAEVRAKGLELEAQMRLTGGSRALISYALQRAADQETGAELPNSPRHMVKARISLPGPTRQSFVSVEGQYLSSRETNAGSRVSAAATVNVTMIQPLSRSWELFGTVRNIFDDQYADPASSQHRQDAIQQNGRTARIGLRWKLSAK